MNVIYYIANNYENKHNWTLGENKPNQTQYPRPSIALILKILDVVNFRLIKSYKIAETVVIVVELVALKAALIV
ncbi:MAG: hypothetical protein ACYS6W_04255 [Planctomycetota bacterium]